MARDAEACCPLAFRQVPCCVPDHAIGPKGEKTHHKIQDGHLHVIYGPVVKRCCVHQLFLWLALSKNWLNLQNSECTVLGLGHECRCVREHAAIKLDFASRKLMGQP